MAVERFPIEAGHVLMFARSIGDPNPVYADRERAEASEVGGLIAPPTFVQASAQFDPDYPLRPRIGQRWFGSGKTPSGLQGRGGDAGADAGTEAEADAGDADAGGAAGDGGERRRGARGGGSGLHAEQHFTYHRTPRVGDVLTATTTPGERWEKQGRRAGVLLFSESITEYRDQDGELVVTARGVTVRTERPVEG